MAITITGTARFAAVMDIAASIPAGHGKPTDSDRIEVAAALVLFEAGLTTPEAAAPFIDWALAEARAGMNASHEAF